MVHNLYIIYRVIILVIKNINYKTHKNFLHETISLCALISVLNFRTKCQKDKTTSKYNFYKIIEEWLITTYNIKSTKIKRPNDNNYICNLLTHELIVNGFIVH